MLYRVGLAGLPVKWNVRRNAMHVESDLMIHRSQAVRGLTTFFSNARAHPAAKRQTQRLLSKKHSDVFSDNYGFAAGSPVKRGDHLREERVAAGSEAVVAVAVPSSPTRPEKRVTTRVGHRQGIPSPDNACRSVEEMVKMETFLRLLLLIKK